MQQPQPAIAPAISSTGNGAHKQRRKRGPNKRTAAPTAATRAATTAPAAAPATPATASAQTDGRRKRRRATATTRPAGATNAASSTRSITQLVHPLTDAFVEYVCRSVLASGMMPSEIQRAGMTNMFAADIERVCRTFAKAA